MALASAADLLGAYSLLLLRWLSPVILGCVYSLHLLLASTPCAAYSLHLLLTFTPCTNSLNLLPKLTPYVYSLCPGVSSLQILLNSLLPYSCHRFTPKRTSNFLEFVPKMKQSRWAAQDTSMGESVAASYISGKIDGLGEIFGLCLLQRVICKR